MAWACPYCAVSDTLSSGISIYVPLVGIILSPFILVFSFFLIVKNNDSNNKFE